MTRRGFIPMRPQQVRLARKAHGSTDDGKCPYCQEKLRVSQPGDALEHEADRAADAVMNRAAPPALGSIAGQFQRDPKDGDKPVPSNDESHSPGAGLGKVVEAAAKTPAGKKAIEKAGDEAKKVLSNPAAAVTTGLIAGGAVAGLAAKNEKLPFQPPAIPLGDTGLSAGLRYEGRLRSPDYVGLTLGGTLPGEPKAKKEKQRDPAAYRAETESMRAELERWKPKPPSRAAPAGTLAPLAQAPASVHEPAPLPLPPKKKEAVPAVQRKASAAGDVTQPVWDALDEGGDALDARTQRFMEQRFGRDFSAVRIHTGPRGAHAADALKARAFTYGEHVTFASGEYHPATESGQRLLAHELAHVAQQGAAPLQSSASAIPAPNRDRMATGPSISSASPGTVARSHPPQPKEKVEIKLGSAGKLTGLKFEVWPEESTAGTTQGLKSFHIDKLILPPSKGANALRVYERYATGNALAATVDVGGSAKAALWQERADTDTLRDRWLDQRGWPTGKGADKYWRQAGGDDTFPRSKGVACQMDHILELQLGGNNTNENIQTLDADKNRESGGTIWAEVSGLANEIKESKKLDTTGATEIRMHFIAVAMQGNATALPATCGDKQPDCLAVETCANNLKVEDTDKRTDITEPYPLTTMGGHETTMKVPKGFAEDKSTKPLSFDESGNKAAATLIPGFLLQTLKRSPQKTTTKSTGNAQGKGGGAEAPHAEVSAVFDTQSKTRLPLEFGAKKGGAATQVQLDVSTAKNVLKLKPGLKNAKLPIHYQYLSPGEITGLTQTPDGLDFVGSITPSVPFLGKLAIAYTNGELSLAKPIDKDKIKLPLPGLTTTKAAIALVLAPELKAEGELGFQYAPSGKKLLDASLKATADTHGLKLAGDIHAYLPGIDSADGHLEYNTTDGWSGSAKATVGDLKKKFKYVKGGEVTVGLKTDSKHGVSVDAGGEVELDLPHASNTKVKLQSKGGRWLFHGKGTFEVPRIKPIDIDIDYDGEHLSGQVHGIGFKYKDFDGTISLQYRDEKFSGSGTLAFAKGRAKGTLQVNLLPDERFTGTGTVTLQIKEGLEATAGVQLDEHEKLHVSGKLAFTKPIKLFDAFGGEATLLKAGISIPIPGASIGPVGVKARIEGELKAGYNIGPGEIRNAAAEANFDPLEENANATFEIGGQLWIGASAHITGAITGSIVLDVLIAEASGSLTVSATATLNGEVLSNVKFTYEKSRYALTADFSASLALAIRLALEASVHASAGIKPFAVDTEKRWTLAAREFDTGLKLGIKVNKRLSYSSDKGLEVPSASDIEVTKPNLDPSRLLKDVFGAADGKEKQA